MKPLTFGGGGIIILNVDFEAKAELTYTDDHRPQIFNFQKKTILLLDMTFKIKEGKQRKVAKKMDEQTKIRTRLRSKVFSLRRLRKALRLFF